MQAVLSSGILRKKKDVKRCSKCRMALHFCYCSEITQIQTKTQVTVIIHALEDRKSSNTGRLAGFALSNSKILIQGIKDEKIDRVVEPGYRPFILHPSGDLMIGSDEFLKQIGSEPVQLIIPDGNWGQAARMAKRIPDLKNVTQLRLPESKSIFGLRKNNEVARLGSMEAIARSLGILEGEEIQVHCENAIRVLAKKLGKLN